PSDQRAEVHEPVARERHPAAPADRPISSTGAVRHAYASLRCHRALIRSATRGLYTESMSDWDAAKYHRISDPQLAWGRAVAAQLALTAGERILDLGCGTGRLTAELAQEPGITVVGLDRSAAMLQQARGQTGVRRG